MKIFTWLRALRDWDGWLPAQFDRWLAEDKAVHFLCSAALTFAQMTAGVSPAQSWANTSLAAGPAVEAVQWFRELRWKAGDYPSSPAPEFASRPSWRDMVANAAGATFAIVWHVVWS